MIQTICNICGTEFSYYRQNKGPKRTRCDVCGRRSSPTGPSEFVNKGNSCLITDCISEAYCKSLCNNHYMQFKRYDITADQFIKMMLDQNGCCRICDEPFSTPYIDHCHTTGRVRGLLCLQCNSGLGFFKEDPKMLEKAAEYLRGD